MKFSGRLVVDPNLQFLTDASQLVAGLIDVQ